MAAAQQACGEAVSQKVCESQVWQASVPGRALGVGVEEKGTCSERSFSTVLQDDGARMVWPGGRHAESGRKRASVGRR